MTDAIDPIRRASSDRRVRGRRKTDGPQAEGASRTAGASGVVLVAPIEPASPAAEIPEPIVTAQILGDSGPASSKAPHLARAAYLEVEWSGRADRRTRRGRIAKTDI